MKFWIVVYAIGAAQAAMLALALWRRPMNVPANRVLAFWLGVIAADLAIKASHLAWPDSGVDGAFTVARLLPFAYAPLFFLYVRALVGGRDPGWRALLHGIWLLLALGWAMGRCLADTALPAAGDWHQRWFDPLLFSVAFAYLAAAALEIRRYRRWLRARRSDADRLSLRWLAALAGCQFVIWGIAALHALADMPGVDYFMIYGAVAGWVCVAGWFSLGQPPVTEPLPALPSAREPAQAPADGDDPRVDDVAARLSALMSGQAMYREPALTIAQLARRSGYPEYLVSMVINRRLGGNFWEYVNRHRIEAVRDRLGDPGDGRSILEIAYDAGFTSKSTFNTAFKRMVGETPSAYRRRHAGGRSLPS
ncbi:helix-turn-helix domain-containing protein [Luteimonas saliphila]|uniref:helix-turn-helix domain-containing protein n=1 Tax=Luteimonas saliphila TaxID=2804919 RepID=UPI00192DE621|nr:AraC family transcriptional regulator [Luteimonas saliphila]